MRPLLIIALVFILLHLIAEALIAFIPWAIVPAIAGIFIALTVSLYRAGKELIK